MPGKITNNTQAPWCLKCLKEKQQQKGRTLNFGDDIKHKELGTESPKCF